MAEKSTVHLQFTKRPKNRGGMLATVLAGRPGQAPDDRLDIHFQADWRGAVADMKSLEGYRKVCGLDDDGKLPMLYVHAMAMPLHMAMFTHRTFPLRLFGLLHFSNGIQTLRPVGVDEKMDLHAEIDGITPTPRGQQFTILTSVSVKGEVVWRETSTYLSPLPPGARTKSEKPAGAANTEPDWGEPVATWKLGADAGRRFAGPAGDPNPIHMSAITAKMFGFRSAIAHGMYSAARCLAILQKDHPVEGPCAFDVRFKRPLFIPGAVALFTAADGDATRFVLKVQPKGEPHIDGRLAPIPEWKV